MRFFFWRIWFDALHFDRAFTCWMTGLGVLILVLSSWELLRGRRRYGLLVLLNILFFATVVMELGSGVTAGMAYGGHKIVEMPAQERLAEGFMGSMAYLLGWFYICFIFLVLLVLCQLRESLWGRKPRNAQVS